MLALESRYIPVVIGLLVSRMRPVYCKTYLLASNLLQYSQIVINIQIINLINTQKQLEVITYPLVEAAPTSSNRRILIDRRSSYSPKFGCDAK